MPVGGEDGRGVSDDFLETQEWKTVDSARKTEDGNERDAALLAPRMERVLVFISGCHLGLQIQFEETASTAFRIVAFAWFPTNSPTFCPFLMKARKGILRMLN